MAVTIYNAIEKPVLTDKSSKLVNKLNQVVLNVHPDANKPLVAQALKQLFNVEVKSVRIIVRKGKKRIFKRIASYGKTTKRAIVTLKPGYSLNVADTAVAGSENAKPEQVGHDSNAK